MRHPDVANRWPLRPSLFQVTIASTYLHFKQQLALEATGPYFTYRESVVPVGANATRKRWTSFGPEALVHRSGLLID